jgi:hypothetical protein
MLCRRSSLSTRCADLAADAAQVSRRCGFGFVEHPSDLGQRQFLGIVAAQPETVSRLECGHRSGDAVTHPAHISGSLRVYLVAGRRQRAWRLVFRQRIVTADAPDPIDVALRQHRAQPRGQTAASVEVAEMRSALAVTHVEPEQLAVERVREIARPASGIDGIRRSVQNRPMLANEMLPRRLRSLRARARERQVFDVERLEIPLELTRVRRLGGERLLCTRLQRRGEDVHRQRPSVGTRFPVKPLDDRAIE